MKRTAILLSIFMSLSAFAAEPAQKAENAKEHLQNHFKLYGFIRNYFIYDSRACLFGSAGNQAAKVYGAYAENPAEIAGNTKKISV